MLASEQAEQPAYLLVRWRKGRYFPLSTLQVTSVAASKILM